MNAVKSMTALTLTVANVFCTRVQTITGRAKVHVTNASRRGRQSRAVPMVHWPMPQERTVTTAALTPVIVTPTTIRRIAPVSRSTAV